MNFKLLGRDIFPYGCRKSISEWSCYSVGLTVVDHVFYTPTYEGGYPCLFGNQLGMRAGHVSYPHMAYDAALQRYFLTFTDYYYRNVQPSSEKGPMVQGGSELIVLEAPHSWVPPVISSADSILGRVRLIAAKRQTTLAEGLQTK